MKTKIQIKDIYGKVLFELKKENNTLKDTLEEAVRQKINLSSANLSYADLNSADLNSADLSDANLSSANLSYANLHSADLNSADLNSADLSDANLSSANLSYANLRSADLSYANLRYANLHSANLHSANLYSADLRSADLNSADLSDAKNKNPVMILLANWGDVSPKLCLELMRYDCANLPNGKKLFDNWVKNDVCPYNDYQWQRVANFNQVKSLWKYGKSKTALELCEMLIKEKCK